ncbi:MAG: hypothetical protein R6W72_08545 [Desulfurivibrionaceae bacterium]
MDEMYHMEHWVNKKGKNNILALPKRFTKREKISGGDTLKCDLVKVLLHGKSNRLSDCLRATQKSSFSGLGIFHYKLFFIFISMVILILGDLVAVPVILSCEVGAP